MTVDAVVPAVLKSPILFRFQVSRGGKQVYRRDCEGVVLPHEEGGYTGRTFLLHPTPPSHWVHSIIDAIIIMLSVVHNCFQFSHINLQI